MALESIKKNIPLSKQAYNIIKEAITTNELKPGDVLVEEKLSEQLSISRTPIRSALQQLVFHGFAEINENKNVIVSNITNEDIDKISIVRCNLETLAIQLLSQGTKGTLNKLPAIIKEQEELLASGEVKHNYLKFIDLDYDFHVSIAKMTENQYLIEMIEKINLVTNRFLTLSGTMELYSKYAVEEHKMILEYLEKEQYDFAALAIRDHINKVKERILITG